MIENQQEIFDYFVENHGLNLTVSEMEEIREVCLTSEEKVAPEMLEWLIKYYRANIYAFGCYNQEVLTNLIEKATGKLIEKVIK